MRQRVIIAGFGGQGIMSAGKLLVHAGVFDNLQVSWLPSYGPEMRGGTANCHVVVSNDAIGSPMLSDIDALIVMNTPSYDRFSKNVVSGGIVIADSSMVRGVEDRTDIRTFLIPSTIMAIELGNSAFSNIILLGKLIAETGIVSKDSMIKAFEEVLNETKHYLIPEEIKALEMGMEFAHSRNA